MGRDREGGKKEMKRWEEKRFAGPMSNCFLRRCLLILHGLIAVQLTTVVMLLWCNLWICLPIAIQEYVQSSHWSYGLCKHRTVSYSRPQ